MEPLADVMLAVLGAAFLSPALEPRTAHLVELARDVCTKLVIALLTHTFIVSASFRRTSEFLESLRDERHVQATCNRTVR